MPAQILPRSAPLPLALFEASPFDDRVHCPLEPTNMHQTNQVAQQVLEQVIEQTAWEAPELVKSDVSASTQAGAPGGADGGAFS